MRVVILAGGKGTRLAPYTTVLPKPLMPLGDMPVLELLLRQLRRHGLTDITIAVGHLAALIMAYFGDGARWGLKIDYSMESAPLGTAGPLGLIDGLTDPFLVLNGDLLTDLDFSAMIAAHDKVGGIGTIGLHRREIQIQLGVVELDGADRVSRYVEKPSYSYLASMGVYVLSSRVLRFIPPGERFDLPALVGAMVDAGEHVTAFEHRGYWLDIGQAADYAKAQEDFAAIRNRLLRD